MDELAPVSDILALQPMPKFAEALRSRREQVVARWNKTVCDLLPDADALTSAQVRNSIPTILDQMAKALEASDPQPTEKLIEVTRGHGAVRFHESYNIKELILEYRILRRILVEEMDDAFQGVVSTREWMALDIAVDIALQQAVISFLEHQKTQLKSATEAEAKFLSFLAHDMRNSLNNIMLTMQWVEMSVARYDGLQEELEGMRSARESATGTIESMERLLQAERLRKGVKAKREQVGLSALTQEVLSTVKKSADAKGIQLRLAVAPRLTVMSDAGLLTLILQNLLGNAIKYSTQGTITVEAVALEVDQVPSIEMSVNDEGMGIAPDRVATLFEAFTRGETHGQPGVGLGLFIASQAARLLGSRLEVQSTVGRGTTFRFILQNLPAQDAV